MTVPMRDGRPATMDREKILAMLGHLGAQLHEQGLTANIQVVGGAAIALTFPDTRVTADLDAVVLDHSVEFHAAERVTAVEFDEAPDWASDGVADFMAHSPEGEQTLIALPGVNVYVASPEHLLAMKLRAATVRMTDRDQADLMLLARHLELETPEQLAQLTERQFRGGVYQDSLGYDEYFDAAQMAFLTDDLAAGRDPMARWEESQTGRTAAGGPSIDDGSDDWSPDF